MAKSFLGSLVKGSIKLAKAVAKDMERARKRTEKEIITAQRNAERFRLKNERERIKAQREVEKLKLKEEKERERLRKLESRKSSLSNISEINPTPKQY